MLKALFIALLLLIPSAIASQDVMIEEDLYCRVAPAIIKAAHAYHGIDCSYYDHARGRFSFDRDGQVCKLFTDEFLKEYQ